MNPGIISRIAEQIPSPPLVTFSDVADITDWHAAIGGRRRITVGGPVRDGKLHGLLPECVDAMAAANDTLSVARPLARDPASG